MEKINKNLTLEQAYCAMIDYLDKYYFKTYADDIGDLLGGMVFLKDGSTADPAAWADWLRAVDKVKPFQDIHENTNIFLTIFESYTAMINFLENYAHLTHSEETRTLIDEKMILKDDKPVDIDNWNEWMRSVEIVLAQSPLVLPPFTLLN